MFILGAAVRFIHFALFDGTLLSLPAYGLDTAVAIGCAAAGLPHHARPADGAPVWVSREGGVTGPARQSAARRWNCGGVGVTFARNFVSIRQSGYGSEREPMRIKGFGIGRSHWRRDWRSRLRLRAQAQVKLGGRRPDHRRQRRLRGSAQERRRAGGRGHQRGRRHSRPEDRAERRRRPRRSQGGRIGRQQVRRRRREIRDRPLQFRRHHPGLRRLPGERHAGDHAGRHQPQGHRAPGMWNVFRVCGRDDQQGGVAGAHHRRPSSRASASPSSTTRPPTARASPTRPARR